MTVSKALGLGIVVLLGLATLDVVGPSPFGASADAATNCPPNTPANKCRAAARNPVAGNANQPKLGGAPAGTAASPEKVSPRKAAEEDARQKRRAEEETNRQKKQAAEEAARQKQQAAKNPAKQQSNGNTGTPGAPTSTKANAGTSGTPPGGRRARAARSRPADRAPHRGRRAGAARRWWAADAPALLARILWWSRGGWNA